jgi:hypothetical protein
MEIMQVKGERRGFKEEGNKKWKLYDVCLICVRRFIKANTHQCPLNDFFYYLVGLLASSESRIWNFAQSIHMVICRLILAISLMYVCTLCLINGSSEVPMFVSSEELVGTQVPRFEGAVLGTSQGFGTLQFFGGIALA